MTELIVALDLDSALDARILACNLYDELGISWFKIGPRFLLNQDHFAYELMYYRKINLFLDLKLYDTEDTVRLTTCSAFDYGYKLLTIHHSKVQFAMDVLSKSDHSLKIISVGSLTDNPSVGTCEDERSLRIADGIICSVASSILWYRDQL